MPTLTLTSSQINFNEFKALKQRDPTSLSKSSSCLGTHFEFSIFIIFMVLFTKLRN